MLDIRYCFRKAFFVLEKMQKAGFFFVRFNEVLSTNAVCKTIRSQRNRVLLSLQTLAEILWFCPSFEDVVSFQNVCDNARYVLGEVLLMKPQRIEGDFIPGNTVYLIGQPQFSCFDDLTLDWLILMAAVYDFLRY